MAPRLPIKPAHLALLALLTLLTVLLFGSVLGDLQGRIVGLTSSEQFSGAWVNAWAVRAMVEELRFPFTVPGVIFPEGSVIYPASLPTALLSAPFAGLLNSAGLFNMAMLLNFALALVGAWLFFRHLGGEPWAALPGAVLFALSPYFLDCMVNGPIEGTAVGWIPLCLWAVERHGGAGWRPALLRGVMVGLCFAANPYYGLFTALMTAYLLLSREGEARFSTRARRVAATALVSALLMLPLAWALDHSLTHPRSMTPEGQKRRESGFVSEYVARDGARDMGSMVLPTRAFDPRLLIHGAYLGLAALALCGVAVARVRGARRWLWPGLAFLLLALGGSLRLGGELIQVAGAPVPLPGRWLLQYVPPFSSMTHPYRAQPMIVLAMGAMITLLLARKVAPRHRPAASCALSLVIGLDLLLLFGTPAPLPAAPFKVPAFYTDLAAEPGDFGVVDIPPSSSDYILGRYLLYQLVHGKRLPYNLDFWRFGPSAPLSVLAFLEGVDLILQEPNLPRSWDKEARAFRCKVNCDGPAAMAAMGYRYMVLHHTGHAPLDDKLAACVERCLPRVHHRDNEVTVYRLPASAK